MLAFQICVWSMKEKRQNCQLIQLLNGLFVNQFSGKWCVIHFTGNVTLVCSRHTHIIYKLELQSLDCIRHDNWEVSKAFALSAEKLRMFVSIFGVSFLDKEIL